MKTFEEWCEDNLITDEMMSDPETIMELAEQYDEYRAHEAGRIAKFGRGWLEGERRELRHRVDEVLNILNKDGSEPDVKHAWLYSQIGELEYAQRLDLLETTDVLKMKNELFDAFEQAKQRQRG